MKPDNAPDAEAAGRATARLAVVAVVLALSMLSYYVHLLHQAVQRGETLRKGQSAPVHRSLVLGTAEIPEAVALIVAPSP